MKDVKEFINAIKDEEEGFSFGEPSRVDEKSITAVLPICRKSKERRGYIVLPEAKEVKMEDTGRIDSVLVTNEEKKPVFIRAGNIFKGKTQERAAIISRIVMPDKTEKIDVVCIHQSRPIHAGAKYRTAGITPRSVNLSNQDIAWSSTVKYSASVSESANSLRNHTPNDVHIGSISFDKMDDLSTNIKEFSKAIESMLKKVPFVNNQVGLALIDSKGFSGIEVFNLSNSWKALKDDIIRREGEKISEIDTENTFEYKSKNAKKQVKGALSKEFAEKLIYEDKDTQTIAVTYNELVGEVTILKDKIIHLNLMRNP